jgi:ferredoxin--NADP+ reductase/benzoate/toluate 1,2-dioxygenase reductase subunit
MIKTSPRRFRAEVANLKQLSSSGFELTFTREGLDFQAGRIITIHGPSHAEDRSYTIASGEDDEHLQILFRLIPQGKLTPRLTALKPGDPIEFSGPFGEFVVRDPARPIIFVATGTGVAPCRSYIRTRKDLNLTLVHGVRRADDLFYRDEFSLHVYHPCVTREKGVGYHGRVTRFLESFEYPADAQFHLCGANEMIFDMQMLLKKRGVNDFQIFTEAYYYRLYS